MTGSISHVLVQLPHVFQRLEVGDLASLIDARYSPSPVSSDACLGATERDLTLAYKFRTGFHIGFIDYHLPKKEMR